MANVPSFTQFMSLNPGFGFIPEENTSEVGVARVKPCVIRTLLCWNAGGKEEQEIERKSFHLKIFFSCNVYGQ